MNIFTGGNLPLSKLSQPLSSVQIKSELPSGIPIHIYQDLKKYTSLDQVLGKKGAAVLLYPGESDHNGHWVTVFKNINEKGKPIVEFFDPYGEPPDAQKDGISKNQLEKMRMEHPDLTRLLEESGCHVIFNKVQLQKLANDVQTCGRHAVCRLLYYKMPIQKDRQMIQKSGMNPDEFVVTKTYNNLGK